MGQHVVARQPVAHFNDSTEELICITFTDHPVTEILDGRGATLVCTFSKGFSRQLAKSWLYAKSEMTVQS